MGEPRVLTVAWMPLDRVALCLDCEACYPLGEAACPRCGSLASAALCRFLAGRAEGERRAPAPDRWVSFRAVEDRVANGLTPGRLYAERLIGAMAELRRRCGGRDVGSQILADVSATWADMIRASIDETVARVRALWKETDHEAYRENHDLGGGRSGVGSPRALAPRAHDPGGVAR